MIAEFQLPSNPKVTVKLREATVAEAIDFSAVDPRAEETATTLFLNTVQEEPAVDAGLWTGEDRRFALFQYHLNTTQERTMPVTFTCPRCGGTHTVDVSLSQIMAGYRPMQGEPFREVVLDGHNVRVMPPNGRGLELLERYRFDLEATQNIFCQVVCLDTFHLKDFAVYFFQRNIPGFVFIKHVRQWLENFLYIGNREYIFKIIQKNKQIHVLFRIFFLHRRGKKIIFCIIINHGFCENFIIILPFTRSQMFVHKSRNLIHV